MQEKSKNLHTTVINCALTVFFCAVLAPLISFAAPKVELLQPKIILPPTALSPKQLGVVFNSTDPISVRVANYYAKRREIPKQNLIGLKLDADERELSREQFAELKHHVDSTLPKNVQALALVWTQPYRVECMSITAAFAFGFDEAFCASGCKPTRQNPYAASPSVKPFTELNLRPAMLIPTPSFELAKQLIDTGIAADHSDPSAKALLLNTSDEHRNVRSVAYSRAEEYFGNAVDIEIINADTVKDRRDTMFYFTGAANVENLDSIEFLPGAIADHLTSHGGRLTESSGQMSSLRWLEAGATGSYGAVAEPCNFIEKFPNPLLAMFFYLQGSTLIEAYWKSVKMPGQGVFIGEPLARPFTATEVSYAVGTLIFRSQQIRPGLYELEGGNSIAEPFIPVASQIRITELWQTVRVPAQEFSIYRLRSLGLGAL